MITFSDKPKAEIKSVRLSIINQLSSRNILLKEDYEKLFRCKINGLNIPTQTDYLQSISLLSKKVKISLIQNSSNNFSPFEVLKIFGETGNAGTLFLNTPYKHYKDTPISDIPLDAVDEDGKNICDTILNTLSLHRDDISDTSKPPLFSKIERFTYPGKFIIDTQKIRQEIVSTFTRENPETKVYREDMNKIFKSTNCYYHSYETRQLISRDNLRKRLINGSIAQLIQCRTDATYEAIGVIFNRDRAQIREIARENGILRTGRGIGRTEQQQETIPRHIRRSKETEEIEKG